MKTWRAVPGTKPWNPDGTVNDDHFEYRCALCGQWRGRGEFRKPDWGYLDIACGPCREADPLVSSLQLIPKLGAQRREGPSELRLAQRTEDES